MKAGRVGSASNFADVIVDIVETGTTSKRTGLRSLKDYAYFARVIVNMASMKLRKEEIESFVDIELAKENLNDIRYKGRWHCSME